jgi:putative sigma-54 modulation protein
MKTYVESKIAHAVQRYSQILREIDVTVSARGGDTGTHGPK